MNELVYKSKEMDYKKNKKIKVKVNNLTKYYGDLLVLDDINFEIFEGEMLSIVGPTGCGKTTFLNTLANFIPATKGEILVDGIPANPIKQNIGFVFQEPSAIPWLTVEENIRFGLEIKNLPEKTTRSRIEEMLKLVGLENNRNSYPRELSSSMEQRIVIARNFAIQPDLLLMDEPYGQLDIKLRYYLEDELLRIQNEIGSTVLFVTHNIEEAVYMGDRILVLSNKPAKIKEEVIVNLSRPRKFDDPEFVEIREFVTESIRWW